MEATTTPTELVFIRHEGEITPVEIIGYPKSRYFPFTLRLPDGSTRTINHGHTHPSPGALIEAEAEHRAIEAMCREQGYGLGRYTGD